MPDAQAPGEAREVETTIPGWASVDLPTRSKWRLSVLADGYWVEPRRVEVGTEPSVIPLAALPAGYLRGRVEVPSREEPPSVLELRLERGEQGPAERQAVAACPLTEGRFRCPVPAGRIDLRLSAPGFIAHYRWDVEIGWREDTDLGSLKLEPGASVVGWVEIPDPSDEDQEATVGLMPLVAGHAGRGERERHIAVALETSTDTRGFFQLAGVAPGSYSLEARHPRFSTARVSPVVVEGREETEIDPIELVPRASLEVRVSPARDPARQPWELRLMRQTADPSYWEPVEEGSASYEGAWKVSGLDHGRYGLRVADGMGGIWASKKLDVAATDVVAEISIPRRRLQVDFLLGDEPLVDAQAQIREVRGNAQFGRTTDERGAAYFFLPFDRRWDIEVRQQKLGVLSRFENIEIPQKKFGDLWSRLELEVPDTTIEGEVVDAQGRRLDDPAVLEVHAEDRYLDKWTRADGRFVVRGLQPGTASLQARHRGSGNSERESQVVQVDLVEGVSPGPVRLVLEESIRLRGLVISSARQGVPGARVFAFPETDAGRSLQLPQEFTDMDGVFDLKLPATSRAAQIAVFPLGFAATQIRVELPSEEPVLILVEQEGGTVSISYEDPPEELQDPKALFDPLEVGTSLLRDGLVGTGVMLQEWSRRNGAPQYRGELTLPMLEPGSYTACFGRDLAQLLSRGAQLPGEVMRRRCVSGNLVPYGELYLEIPKEAMAAALKAGG